ncbi:phosphopantetheine-binding protein [Micromonospora inyonensis]|uniref:Phosphopantetheine attachment site n=1 Tax=Micromonospora inyonensis TaxID=47866 RepID=A0A1C6SN36_9ACTN|nr:phosphopantetheine-binding protein [Micromonospora inyonensis]SCL31001.1 Phosphopantetheine attachment site [Micromonospora inyonensis]
MSVDVAALQKEAVEWVREWNEDDLPVDLDVDTPLLAKGLLDSMGMVAFVSFLEERFDLRFDFTSFVPGPNASIRTLLDHCLGR